MIDIESALKFLEVLFSFIFSNNDSLNSEVHESSRSALMRISKHEFITEYPECCV